MVPLEYRRSVSIYFNSRLILSNRRDAGLRRQKCRESLVSDAKNAQGTIFASLASLHVVNRELFPIPYHAPLPSQNLQSLIKRLVYSFITAKARF